MLLNPFDVLHHYPVRKTRAQKQVFRDAVTEYAQSMGYSCRVEKGSFGCRNVVIGDPDSATYLVTAHYDTCAGMLLPNFITPCNLALYILYSLLLILVIGVASIAFGILVTLAIGDAYIGTETISLFFWLFLLLMIFGPANKHNANDNTSGVVTLLEIARTIPENHRDKVCFVLFDLEEAGLIGSAAYRKAHKKVTDRQLVLNLDCVGDGDNIRIFPTKKLRKDCGKRAPLYKVCGYFGNKSLLVQDKGFAFYPSDQTNFPWGVGIAALHKGKCGLYLGRIHTSRDTVLEETNVNILRAALTTLICCDTVN